MGHSTGEDYPMDEYTPSPPLAPVYLLIEYGLWPYPVQERDTANDVTDAEVSTWL